MGEIDDFKAAARSAIEEHGWHVVLVAADEDRPAYGLTLGLTERFGHPELCAVGLDDAQDGGLMHDLLDSAAEFVAEGGRLAAGTRNTELLVGHSLGVRPISAAMVSDWLALGVAVLGRNDFAALQLLWPDRRGRLPIDPQCESKVLASQPVLGP